MYMKNEMLCIYNNHIYRNKTKSIRSARGNIRKFIKLLIKCSLIIDSYGDYNLFIRIHKHIIFNNIQNKRVYEGAPQTATRLI